MDTDRLLASHAASLLADFHSVNYNVSPVIWLGDAENLVKSLVASPERPEPFRSQLLKQRLP